MLIDVECPDCFGAGEVQSITPGIRSRMVGRDDLDPSDFVVRCPRCLGSGVVEHDLEEDAE